MSKEFSAKDWINRLAQTLPKLEEVQKPFLKKYREQNPHPRVYTMHQGADNNASALLLDDLTDIYGMARRGIRGKEVDYAPLLEALDPVRGILRSHPTLERVVSQIIGDDNFFVQINAVGSGQPTSLTDLVAGLMVRTHERPEDGFETAAAELQAFMDPAGEKSATDTLGDLGVGYDMVLFHGLSLKKKISIEGDMEMMSFEQAQAFVDEDVLINVAPDIVQFRDWQMVGAVTRPFPWRPEFRRSDRPGSGMTNRPKFGPFVQDVLKFLDLLAVSHRVPVAHLVNIQGCISRSACYLLGQAHTYGTMHWGRPTHLYDPPIVPTKLSGWALRIVKATYEIRRGKRYQELAPIIARLAVALSRDGRFAVEDRILDVAIALERMYALDRDEVSYKMRTRAAWFLGENAQSRRRVLKSAKEFYDVRSEIVHNRKQKVPAERYNKALRKGFDIAVRTLFKLLDQGPPDWEKLVIEGEKAADQ